MIAFWAKWTRWFRVGTFCASASSFPSLSHEHSLTIFKSQIFRVTWIHVHLKSYPIQEVKRHVHFLFLLHCFALNRSCPNPADNAILSACHDLINTFKPISLMMSRPLPLATPLFNGGDTKPATTETCRIYKMKTTTCKLTIKKNATSNNHTDPKMLTHEAVNHTQKKTTWRGRDVSAFHKSLRLPNFKALPDLLHLFLIKPLKAYKHRHTLKNPQ